MATIKMLQKLGLKNLRVAYTAGDYNIGQLNPVYDIAKDLGLEFTLAAVHNSENFFSTDSNTINMF